MLRTRVAWLSGSLHNTTGEIPPAAQARVEEVSELRDGREVKYCSNKAVLLFCGVV